MHIGSIGVFVIVVAAILFTHFYLLPRYRDGRLRGRR